MPTAQSQAAYDYNVNRGLPQHGRVHAYDDWKLRGTCQTNPDLSPSDFYDLQSKTREHMEMLRATCAACPVLSQCAELGRKEPWGFLAGKTEEERERGKKREQAVARAIKSGNPVPVEQVRKAAPRNYKQEAWERSEKRRIAREEVA